MKPQPKPWLAISNISLFYTGPTRMIWSEDEGCWRIVPAGATA